MNHASASDTRARARATPNDSGSRLGDDDDDESERERPTRPPLVAVLRLSSRRDQRPPQNRASASGAGSAHLTPDDPNRTSSARHDDDDGESEHECERRTHQWPQPQRSRLPPSRAERPNRSAASSPLSRLRARGIGSHRTCATQGWAPRRLALGPPTLPGRGRVAGRDDAAAPRGRARPNAWSPDNDMKRNDRRATSGELVRAPGMGCDEWESGEG